MLVAVDDLLALSYALRTKWTCSFGCGGNSVDYRRFYINNRGVSYGKQWSRHHNDRIKFAFQHNQVWDSGGRYIATQYRLTEERAIQLSSTIR